MTFFFIAYAIFLIGWAIGIAVLQTVGSWLLVFALCIVVADDYDAWRRYRRRHGGCDN